MDELLLPGDLVRIECSSGVLVRHLYNNIAEDHQTARMYENDIGFVIATSHNEPCVPPRPTYSEISLFILTSRGEIGWRSAFFFRRYNI